MTLSVLIKFARDAATVGGGLLRWAEERKRPQVNWKTQFVAVSSTVKSSRRAGTAVWITPCYSRNSILSRRRERRYVHPCGCHRHLQASVLSLTLPGSMSDEMIAWGLGEMEGILKQAYPESGVQFCCGCGSGNTETDQKCETGERVDARVA